MNFYENYVGLFFHAIMFSVNDFKFNNQPPFNVSLSDEKYEYFQEVVRTYVCLRHLQYDILQLRYR